MNVQKQINENIIKQSNIKTKTIRVIFEKEVPEGVTDAQIEEWIAIQTYGGEINEGNPLLKNGFEIDLSNPGEYEVY